MENLVVPAERERVDGRTADVPESELRRTSEHRWSTDEDQGPRPSADHRSCDGQVTSALHSWNRSLFGLWSSPHRTHLFLHSCISALMRGGGEGRGESATADIPLTLSLGWESGGRGGDTD